MGKRDEETIQPRTIASEAEAASISGGGTHALEPLVGAATLEATEGEGINEGAALDAAGDEGIDEASIGGSAALISVCTIISRITGFVRTWAMAYALGATVLSSSYQVANNLPNMLYELVMGGMLTIAFLPVYMSVKKKLGSEKSSEYASNLLTFVVLALGVLAVVCMVFPSQIVYTQSFYSDQNTMGTATLLFQFFAIQVVFYGASSIISGILNANRDYIWGAIAPVFNNIIVIAAFIVYSFVAPTNQELAIYIIALGSPLGVFVQMAIQIPGLKRNGIRLRPRLDLKDPSLRETASLGIPALLITLFEFVVVSVMNAASYGFAANGPSVLAYSRLWFTFPYSFLAIPVSTAMFTELSHMQAEGNTAGVIKGIVSGSAQILFLMAPFAAYLVVYAQPLVTLYHIGAFTAEDIAQISLYLAVMALALPFYGVNFYLQMVFSSIRRMKAFSIICLAYSALQVIVTMAAVGGHLAGSSFFTIEWIAIGSIVGYGIGDVISFVYLRHMYSATPGGFPVSPLIRSLFHGLVLGIAGALAGGLVFYALETFVSPVYSSVLLALVYVVISGVISMAVTFIPAVRMDLPEAVFVTNLWRKLSGRLHRR